MLLDFGIAQRLTDGDTSGDAKAVIKILYVRLKRWSSWPFRLAQSRGKMHFRREDGDINTRSEYRTGSSRETFAQKDITAVVAVNEGGVYI